MCCCHCLLSTSVGEGRDLFHTLIPRFLARLFRSDDFDHVDEHDILGQEQKASRDEKSVRVYKCSKTYNQSGTGGGVQALKEVTLQVNSYLIIILLPSFSYPFDPPSTTLVPCRSNPGNVVLFSATMALAKLPSSPSSLVRVDPLMERLILVGTSVTHLGLSHIYTLEQKYPS